MEGFTSQIKQAAEEEDDFDSFRERMKIIDDKFINVFYAQKHKHDQPESVFRAQSFAKPEMTIQQERMQSIN